MKLTLKVKLNTTDEDLIALKEIMELFNEACNFISGITFDNRTGSKVKIQQLCYYDVRKKFGLSSQLTIRAIAKVCEAYKRDKSIQPKFKPHGAITYDQRVLGWKGLDMVSILTLKGRRKIQITICDYYKPRMDRIRGQADLILVKGIFYLCVIVEVDEPDEIKPTEALGIDMGIVNLAVDSDGKVHTGEDVEMVRSKVAKHRASLQSCGSRSAKRHLKKLSGKESRFRRDTNHIISKNIVAKAKDTGRAIALEDLSNIRKQTTVRKAQRSRHSSWGFYQLRQFIEYKAKLSGVPVILVDPRYTSQTCPDCGHVCKENRVSRNDFKCVQCGFAGLSDHIASINIGVRAIVSTPIVSVDIFGSH